MFFEFWSVFVTYALQVLPWFFGGLVVAIFIERFWKNKSLPVYFRKYNPISVSALLLMGMISPLSILSGLPLATQFIRKGAHPALLLSFFAAERVYDLHSFPIIASMFGISFAVLNALIVFIALFAASWIIRNDTVTYVRSTKKTNVSSSTWRQHVKMLCIVIMGIIVAALFRVAVPAELFSEYSGGLITSVLTALALGLFLYLGTIAGNYPLAKAFSDLGMHTGGVMAFLSVSSLFNVVILSIFASSISFKVVAKYFLIYASITGGLSILFGYLFT